MKKAYVSPEAIKVNFETKDIITVSGMLSNREWSDWNGEGVMSISWNDLVN
ncbi:MAG: hypothetical protein IJW79_08225 [Clostridia bacterium]|nr:hypothetical protein [Clostridia bacterium]